MILQISKDVILGDNKKYKEDLCTKLFKSPSIQHMVAHFVKIEYFLEVKANNSYDFFCIKQAHIKLFFKKEKSRHLYLEIWLAIFDQKRQRKLCSALPKCSGRYRKTKVKLCCKE